MRGIRDVISHFNPELLTSCKPFSFVFAVQAIVDAVALIRLGDALIIPEAFEICPAWTPLT